jgi:heptaprenyl diphosphate synthase
MVAEFVRAKLSPLHSFAAGVLIIPAYLLQEEIVIKVVQVVIFGALARSMGKRIKWLYFLILALSITVFNLLNPYGEVLVRLGPLAVTSGALIEGILKGLTIVGLVFISLFSIRPELQLPGRLGGIIGKTFLYFQRILEQKRRVEAKRLVGSVDEILLELYQPGTAVAPPKQAPVRTAAVGVLAAGLFAAVNWAALLV